MAMRLNVKGMDDLITALQMVGADSDEIISKAMYDGAGMILDAVKREIEALPEDDGYKKDGVLRSVITSSEKKDLIDHLGIAHFQKNGGKVSTAVGFNGYSSHRTKKYPNGVPIALIARSIQSGSTVRSKNAFMNRAMKSVKEQVTLMMQTKIHEEIQKKMEG